MIPGHLTLAGLIRSELAELERSCAVVGRHWARVATADDPDAYVGSAALHLHAFYSGVERILEQIARDMDGRLPASEAWHSELLAQMAIEVPGVRPAVLAGQTARALDEYRRFRHLVRNVYAAQLDPGLMAPIVQGLPAAMSAVRQDLESFCAFLEQAAHADET